MSTTYGFVAKLTVASSFTKAEGVVEPRNALTSIASACALVITPVIRPDVSTAVPSVLIVPYSLKLAFSGLFPLISFQPTAVIKSPVTFVLRNVTIALAPQGLPR